MIEYYDNIIFKIIFYLKLNKCRYQNINLYSQSSLYTYKLTIIIYYDKLMI